MVGRFTLAALFALAACDATSSYRPAVQEAFLAYLDDESPIVRVATADLALYRDLARDRAYSVLKEIRDSYPGIPDQIGSTALVMLKKWTLEHDPLRRARQRTSAQPPR